MTTSQKSVGSHTSEIAAPAERLGFLIYRAGLLISQAYEARMRPLGYSAVEIGVLTYLASDKESKESHVRGIARALGVSPQTVVNVTLELERRQLVQRVKFASDRRVTRIMLSEDGKEALRSVDEVAKAFDEEIAEKIGPAPTAAVMQGLKTLINAGAP